MTALHKNEPRYIIATVTGYTINPGVHENNARIEMTSYTVLDRAHNHRIVAAFNATTRNRDAVWCERAQLTCAALNNETPIPWWETKNNRLHHGPPTDTPPEGQPYLPPPHNPKHRPRRFDWNHAAELHHQGHTIRQIAKQLGVSHTSIRHALGRRP